MVSALHVIPATLRAGYRAAVNRYILDQDGVEVSFDERFAGSLNPIHARQCPLTAKGPQSSQGAPTRPNTFMNSEHVGNVDPIEDNKSNEVGSTFDNSFTASEWLHRLEQNNWDLSHPFTLDDSEPEYFGEFTDQDSLAFFTTWVSRGHMNRTTLIIWNRLTFELLDTLLHLRQFCVWSIWVQNATWETGRALEQFEKVVRLRQAVHPPE